MNIPFHHWMTKKCLTYNTNTVWSNKFRRKLPSIATFRADSKTVPARFLLARDLASARLFIVSGRCVVVSHPQMWSNRGRGRKPIAIASNNGPLYRVKQCMNWTTYASEGQCRSICTPFVQGFAICVCLYKPNRHHAAPICSSTDEGKPWLLLLHKPSHPSCSTTWAATSVASDVCGSFMTAIVPPNCAQPLNQQTTRMSLEGHTWAVDHKWMENQSLNDRVDLSVSPRMFRTGSNLPDPSVCVCRSESTTRRDAINAFIRAHFRSIATTRVYCTAQRTQLFLIRGTLCAASLQD